MAAKQSSSLQIDFHSCQWCQRILLDFSCNNPLPSSPDPADPQRITIPMLFEGFTANDRERGEFIRCINNFLSLSADAGCLFSQTVMNELGASHGEQPVRTIFSWIGGLEFIGANSSVCLLNYYWGSKISTYNELSKA
jgi:hypothetical protein